MTIKDANYKLAMTLFIAKHEQALREYMAGRPGSWAMSNLVELKKEMFGGMAHRGPYATLISACVAELRIRDINAARSAAEN